MPPPARITGRWCGAGCPRRARPAPLRRRQRPGGRGLALRHGRGSSGPARPRPRGDAVKRPPLAVALVVLPVVVLAVLHLAGARQYLGVLSGTRADGIVE